MDIRHYLDEVRSTYATGKATEHSYRPALQKLFAGIDPALSVVNEPRKSEVGAPDFIFTRGDVPIGWCEHKDIDKDVVKLTGYSKEQKDRYRRGLPNLLYTNGLDFEFIRDGERIAFVTIADLIPGLPARPARFGELEKLLGAFAAAQPISISSAAQLARLMAAKAAIIKDVLGNVLREDRDFRSSLGGQYRAFKADLLPHLDPDEFSDIYAETITYGMFAARLHDTSLDTFSRREALDLLPKSNPFLRSLFGYIAGPDLDDRIAWIVDDLADILRASDPSLLFRDFGRFTARNDPFVHFYEDFLREYNPAKRKSRGVWYTPEPVVDFIVRAVDDVLRTEFGLPDGLADTSKVMVDHDTGQNDPKTGKPVTIRREVHRVQILDPATGTGTFLAKAVQTIAARVKARAPGKWSGYVEADLIPRLHGFELLMASYAMCHMKLDMQLRETGYRPSENPPRLSVWLTNALEEGEREVRDLFFHALAEEARGANEVKRNRPIMCVIGNPPYSVSSENRGDWIARLTSDYKKDLDERNIQPLSDDYVKFVRLAQHFIERNSEGVLAFITNNSYTDGVIHRRMRDYLTRHFDKCFIVNLHGDSNKRETMPDGKPDKNVFDIQQGVAIIIAVRHGISERASVAVHDVYGERPTKNEFLLTHSLSNVPWRYPDHAEPYWFLSNADFRNPIQYGAGFPIITLFSESLSGAVSGSDARYVGYERSDLANLPDPQVIRPFLYRPLDTRLIYYDPKRLQRARKEIFVHLMRGPNIALVVPRQALEGGGAMIFDNIIGHKTFSAYNRNYVFPLYLYPSELDGLKLSGQARTLNLDPTIYAAIYAAADLTLSPDAGEGDAFRTATGDARPSEVKVFDYIYGVLHAPAYRATYAEFLRIDFPRIPYPRDPDTFARVSAAGETLRRLHLMESAAIGETPYPFTGEGDDTVASGYPRYEDGAVWINADQRFVDVPALAWDFPIGGYRPAQKWLKDRRGRVLSWDDIGHYQRIVKILTETDRVMRGIDLPLD